jgi:hypothetical protein
VVTVLREAFNGGNFATSHAGTWHYTRANRLTIDMHGTGAALGNTATKFGASQAHNFSNDPQKWHLWFSVNFLGFAIHIEGIH